MPTLPPRHAVERLLPELRAFAHAIGGDPCAADDYLARALECVLAGADTQPLAPLRIRLLAALCATVPCRVPAAPAPAAREPLCLRMADLDERGRRLLLLVELCGFDPSTAARILGLPATRAAALVAAARRRLLAQRSSRVLILEDERVVAMALGEIVESFGHRLVAIAGEPLQALDEAARHRPDLLLADIRLRGDAGGIEVARTLRDERGMAVVFVTAFPHLAVRAVPCCCVVAKPFEPEVLALAMAHALEVTAPR